MKIDLYRLSRWWNRIAYSFIHLGRFLIWDYTSKNDELLSDDDFGSSVTESIMCDRL